MSITDAVSKSESCRAIFGVVNGVQHIPRAGDRILGIAATLLLITRTKSLDLSQLLNQAARLLKDAEHYTPTEVRAATDYVREELA